MSTDETKEPNILDTIKAEYARKPHQPDVKIVKPLVTTYKEARAKAAKAQADYEMAQATVYEATLALAKAYGGRSIKIDGQVLTPSCRNGIVFFKHMGGEVVEVGA